MITIILDFVTRQEFTNEDLDEHGRRTFVCPECKRVHAFYSFTPSQCDNAMCRKNFPNLKMQHSLNLRLKYHFGIKEDPVNEIDWSGVPSMYSRL